MVYMEHFKKAQQLILLHVRKFSTNLIIITDITILLFQKTRVKQYEIYNEVQTIFIICNYQNVNRDPLIGLNVADHVGVEDVQEPQGKQVEIIVLDNTHLADGATEIRAQVSNVLKKLKKQIVLRNII